MDERFARHLTGLESRGYAEWSEVRAKGRDADPRTAEERAAAGFRGGARTNSLRLVRLPQYPGSVTSRSMATERVLGMIAAHRGRIDALLARYGARNPQVFGSVARGDASQISDLDLLVVLDPSGGNPLLRVAGLAEELSELLQMRVDVVADELLKAPVSATAHADAVPL